MGFSSGDEPLLIRPGSEHLLHIFIPISVIRSRASVPDTWPRREAMIHSRDGQPADHDTTLRSY
jgi:hypothetical protein